MTTPTGSIQSTDDSKILQYASDLFEQFRMRKPRPDTVTWENRQDPDLIVVKYGVIEKTLPNH